MQVIWSIYIYRIVPSKCPPLFEGLITEKIPYEISKSLDFAEDFRISGKISRFRERFQDFRKDFKISRFQERFQDFVEISRFHVRLQDFQKDF